jgi:uncharacterized protein YkwD
MKPTWLCLGITCGVLLALTWAEAGEAPSFTMTAEETKLLELTNLERKKKELPPLRPSPALFELARAHSANMAKQGKMEHNLDGKTPFDRMRDAKYLFVMGAENIAACDAKFGLPELMQAWMESKLHRENILGPNYTDIGLGAARDKNGKVYYTQVFTKPQAKD